MDIKEIALNVAEKMPVGFLWSEGCGHESGILIQEAIAYAEALVAELQRQSEPKYIVTWLEGICTLESVGDADLPVEFTELFTFPPSIEALEDKVAEACAEYIHRKVGVLEDVDKVISSIRSGEWRKFMKGK